MKYRVNLVALTALAASTLAMAAFIASGAYGQAAGAEARGVQALSDALVQAVGAHKAPATLVAAAPGAVQ